MTTTSERTTQAPGASCLGCEQDQRASSLTRRTVLRALGLGAGAATMGGMGLVDARAAFAAGPWVGDTLVVLSLRGGFDGLNAVVPVGDADYATLRPTIGVSAGAALPIPNETFFGLHPAMSALTPLWGQNKLAAVQATGLPTPNRSHFEAMDILERATPGTASRTGWLDRMLGLHDSSGPFTGVQLGGTDMPVSLSGPVEVLGMNRLRDFSIDGVSSAGDRARWTPALNALHDSAGTALKGSSDVTLAALTSAVQFATPTAPLNGAVYPNTDLGATLADVARLIRSGLGARVITLDEGNWDMHSGLGTTGSGWQHDKLKDLGDSLAAFAKDLGAALGNVTLVTISEFGRRAHENESNGLDHGWGNVMFVLGGHVNPGVHTTWPGLSPGALVNGDLRATTDYRAVLADVLTNRCGADTAAVGTVFPAFTGTTLGITTP